MAGAVWCSLPFPAAQAWFHLGAFHSGGGLPEEGTQLLYIPQIRYQRVSPDALPLANGRKPTPRTCKDEEADNGRLSFTANGGAFDGKSLRYRPGASPSSAAGQDQNFPPSDSPQSDNNHHHHQHPTRTAHDGGGAAILQWGQNKRSRGSRTERAATAAGGDESSSPARQVIKIHRRAATAVGGGQKPSSMAPPCGAAPYSRGTNLRPTMTVRDHHHSGSLLNRSASDDPRSAAASPSRAHNGIGPRAHPHRPTAGEKRPPALPDKHHKHATAGGKTGGGSGGGNQLETKSSAETEKVSLEAFEWPRIYLSLSRKEKEDDFLAMKGTKLPQRPKKRAKNVDKTLQYCFPGMWLSDLTRGRYEVREKKCVKKRRRGLKGMESMESESE